MKQTNIYTGCRKLAAICVAAGFTALTASSCGFIELRGSYSETDVVVETKAPMLAQAERKNEIAVNRETESVPEASEEKIAEKRKTVRVALAGESVFDGNVIGNGAKTAENNDTADYSFLQMYSCVYKLISGADISVGMCSTPVVSDYSSVGVPESVLESLKSLGFDAVNIAGAHMFDGGAEAIEDSIGNYYDAGLMNYGIYTDSEDYNNIRLLNADGVNIALLAFSGNEAAENSGYIIPGFKDEQALREWIEYADFISDIVIVSVDWAEQSGNTVSAEQKRVAGLMAKAGADIIFGGGGSFQPVEYLDTGDGTVTLCAYSLGNLLSCESEKSGLGGILSFEITAGEGIISIENTQVIPVCTYYTAEYADIRVMPLDSCSDMLTAIGNTDASVDALREIYEMCVPAELREKD